MKLITNPAPREEPFETGSFNNGDLYISRKAYRNGNRAAVWLYSCGMMIDPISGIIQHNVAHNDMKRSHFVNVTSKFTIILNELYDNQRDTIKQLTERVRELEGMV